ncbi:MAG: SWIM zinc finger family protein, partial [Planctomycetota bacterium]
MEKSDSGVQTATKQAGTKRKRAAENKFHQQLASLTYHQSVKLLGGIDGGGDRLMRQGSRFTEIDHERDVFLGGDLLRVSMNDAIDRFESAELERGNNNDAGELNDAEELPPRMGRSIVTITLQSKRSKQLLINCDQCDSLCHCMGGALEHLLSSKSIMGLAAPPDESVPIEHLTEDELFLRAMADREKRAAEDPMRVRSMDNSTPWSDYVVSSRSSGKTYRVAIRGHRHEDVYCTCPDYRTNGLGTCKHILHVQSKLKQRFNQSQLATPYKRKHLSLRLHHGIVGGPDDDGGDFGLRFNLPHDADDKLRELIGD